MHAKRLRSSYNAVSCPLEMLETVVYTVYLATYNQKSESLDHDG